ncbi:unnamed protein product [Arctogadus glacialis]
MTLSSLNPVWRAVDLVWGSLWGPVPQSCGPGLGVSVGSGPSELWTWSGGLCGVRSLRAVDLVWGSLWGPVPQSCGPGLGVSVGSGPSELWTWSWGLCGVRSLRAVDLVLGSLWGPVHQSCGPGLGVSVGSGPSELWTWSGGLCGVRSLRAVDLVWGSLWGPVPQSCGPGLGVSVGSGPSELWTWSGGLCGVRSLRAVDLVWGSLWGPVPQSCGPGLGVSVGSGPSELWTWSWGLCGVRSLRAVDLVLGSLWGPVPQSCGPGLVDSGGSGGTWSGGFLVLFGPGLLGAGPSEVGTWSGGVLRGKAVGIVTTTRVQHATPATSYAHSASRKWYSDADLPASARTNNCTDIASQLLSNTDIDVIIGGGRKYMTPRGTRDPEYPRDYSSRGRRKDGRHLIQEWQSLKAGKVAHYVWNKTDFDAVDPETTDYLMALFEPGDMHFDLERDPLMDPSIAETTEKAIRILSRNPNGFFLLVEGGRIDQAHHAGRGSMALHEAVALDRAVGKALELTNEEETLTVVTADHSHPLVINGYPFRGNSILGKSPLWASDMMPFTTLMYGNGPGNKMEGGKRPDIRKVDTKTSGYVQLAAVPLKSATHGGEDVVILARGPMAHLLQGVHEQSYIAHAMAYAACVGTDRRHCAARPAVAAARNQAGP